MKESTRERKRQIKMTQEKDGKITMTDYKPSYERISFMGEYRDILKMIKPTKRWYHS